MDVIYETLSLKTIDSLKLLNLSNIKACLDTISDCKNDYDSYDKSLKTIASDSQGKIVYDGVDVLGPYMRERYDEFHKYENIFADVDRDSIIKTAREKDLEKLADARKRVKEIIDKLVNNIGKEELKDINEQDNNKINEWKKDIEQAEKDNIKICNKIIEVGNI